MKAKINSITLFICVLISSVLAISCSDDDGDTSRPEINLLAPEEGGALHIGEDVHFSAEFSDNEMLASYKVEIHNNFDSHDHSASLRSQDGTTPFSFQKSWVISGQKNASVHHHEIIIPEDATPGNYHLLVYCTDAAGNESHVARNIVLTHEEGSGHNH